VSRSELIELKRSAPVNFSAGQGEFTQHPDGTALVSPFRAIAEPIPKREAGTAAAHAAEKTRDAERSHGRAARCPNPSPENENELPTAKGALSTQFPVSGRGSPRSRPKHAQRQIVC
jgi:hypothetical protein